MPRAGAGPGMACCLWDLPAHCSSHSDSLVIAVACSHNVKALGAVRDVLHGLQLPAVALSRTTERTNKLCRDSAVVLFIKEHA